MNEKNNYFYQTGTIDLLLSHSEKGEGVKVMIADTGVNKEFLAFPNRVVFEKSLFHDNDIRDRANHGTAITNFIQALAPKADLYILKTLNDSSEGTPENVYNAITYAISKQVDILCLSLGTNAKLSISTEKALQSAFKHGIIIVSASGNFNRNYLQNPANYPEVISVGGLDNKCLDRWYKSNYSLTLDFVAPAQDVKAISNQGNIELRQGTSFANAIVVGQIALMKSIKKDLSVADLRKLGGNNQRKLETGLGILDCNKFIENMKGEHQDV